MPRAEIDQAMLMAAGLGTRLRPFTELSPKPLLPLVGIPITQFALDSLGAAGVRKVVANVHHLPQRSIQGLRALDLHGAELAISDESRELLGSAGGIRHALEHFGGRPFFLVNPDVVCDVDLRALAREHQRLRARWGVSMTMAIFRRAPGRGQYREIQFDEQRGLVTKWGELKQGSSFYIGSAVLEPEAVSHLPDAVSEFVPEILLPLIEKKKAGVFVTSGRWYDVGSPELWLDAHVSLLEAMETGALARSWRLRIEEANRRVGTAAWVCRKSAAPRGLFCGPGYWSGDSSSAVEFGPRAVLYGAVPPRTALHDGIGYGGQWVEITR